MISPVSYYLDAEHQNPFPLTEEGSLNIEGLTPAEAGKQSVIEIFVKNNTKWYLDFDVVDVQDPDLQIIYPPLEPFGDGIVQYKFNPPKDRIDPLNAVDWRLRIISSPKIFGR